MAYLAEAIESLVKKGLKKAVKKNRKKCSHDDLVAIPTANRKLGVVTWDYV